MLYQATKKALAGNPLYEAARRVRVRWREQAQARAQARRQAWLETKSYQERLVIRAAELHPVAGRRVLVVGANLGEDCRLFIERGAAEVHGLDVIENVGQDFAHPAVRYHCAGIEASCLDGDSFDLVFSMATMEHVPDIQAGFAEMARLTRPGGMIFSLAAPLWQSPYGHHMNCFEDHPWVHLVHSDQDALTHYARAHGIEGERGHDIDGIAGYMFNPHNFNRLPGTDYVQACTALTGLEVRRNELALVDEAMLEHPLGRQALAMGFSAENMLATHHHFIAVKL